MRVSKIGVFAIVTLPLAVSLLFHSLENARLDAFAQSAPQVPVPQTSPQAPAESAQPQPNPPAGYRARSPRQTPCWRAVGIAPGKVNQRWRIEDSAKGKIGAVCNDPSLTAEKRRDMIQQVNEQTEQEIAKIIPAKQLEAFKACQAERDQEEARHRATAQKELGPCGGVIPAKPGAPQHSHEHQPSNPPNQ